MPAMTPSCVCGTTMHRHGSRKSPVLHHAERAFEQIEAEVQRFLCPKCGTSSKLERPETEPGFKMTQVAAVEIERLALQHGITATAGLSGLDKSSISRLIASRADRAVFAARPPKAAALQAAANGSVVVTDLETLEARAVFTGPVDERLVDWLGCAPTAAFPDAAIAPHCLSWAGRIQACLTKDVFLGMLAKPLLAAARRLASRLGTKPSEEDQVARLLTSDQGSLTFEETTRLAKIASPGTPGRHFLKLKDRLGRICEAENSQEATGRLNRWIAQCEESWTDIFSPVLQFLSAYRPLMFNHAMSLVVEMPVLTRKFDGPASLINLSLANTRTQAHDLKGPTLRPAFRFDQL